MYVNNKVKWTTKHSTDTNLAWLTKHNGMTEPINPMESSQENLFFLYLKFVKLRFITSRVYCISFSHNPIDGLFW